MRILILEDEPVLGMLLQDILADLGLSNTTTALSVAEALNLIDQEMPRFAFLDINVQDGQSFPVARRLQSENIPFAFCSGAHADTLPSDLQGRPLLMKPYQEEQVAEIIQTGASAG